MTSQLPRIFRLFTTQLLHVVVLPVFYFIVMLIYRPFEITGLLGQEWFGVHITILTCIILVSVIITRLVYYFLPLRLNYTLYAVWCIGEVIFSSFFAALYIWLVLGKSMPYFDALTTCLKHVFLIELYPYIILALSCRVYEYHMKSLLPEESVSARMRFYDDKHNLKLVVTSDSVLYIAAEENYVNIFYAESGKQHNFVLRSSMKAIEEICQEHGLIRCHRSFYVNPKHIKVLRKDTSGVVFAELDAADVRHIPVTKRYYDSLSELL